jgi:hypothetical protein
MLDATAPPLPSRAIIRQHWGELVFLHWRVAPDTVAPFMPAGTRPDIDDNGDAWVGLIPFVLSRTQFFPPLPAVPYLGTFVECNVRLYSIDEAGNRGVVFRSLDAQRALPVLTARALFGLPYRWASMSLEQAHPDPAFDGTRRLEYRSRRLESRADRLEKRRRDLPAASAASAASAQPTRPSTHIVARPGTTAVDTELSRFLTARWGFHERVRGHTIWARNHHEPWPVFDATLETLDDELLAAAGFDDLAARSPDSVLYSPGVTTVFARPTRIA